ncbi:structural maintenance of chromosomes flexible hinge domain-containing protein 1 [Anabas testudineus]|uniref:structural maintenance of chromosomes flexible hinge domain-containing protein 1 n=1 Tax=Anabas testudineus TaxID=64144 RepID=UPI000E463EAF|nr:structural maintenance of chromosomes flexible hinge domain-containing protein 1 [Anabas testudineus]
MSKQSGCASVFASSSAQERKNRRNITVYDYRNQNNVTKKLMETSGWDFNVFLGRLRQVFAINSQELFVLTTTDRTVLDYDKFRKLQDGTTVYLLQTKNQALQVAAVEEITFMPHYDTLIRSGMYEYYASEGQNPLPYALAELIDNSLSATAKNKGTRTIEIQMMFNETLGKPAVIVLDNGCGMTPQKLNNWAVYRLSKFTRQNSLFASNEEGYVRPKPVHRSLNSDISFFGVGGKQAVFYIGTSTMIISKSVASPDVHELVLSKEDFERKEKNKEEIYKTTIRNRKPGDFSHMNKTNELFLRDLISEELGKGSFTAVVITGVQPDHIKYLKQDFQEWTRRLAHIYHYYIHGVNGNVRDNPGTSSSTNSELPKIDIQITLREKPPKIPHVMNLREVEDDMQSRYIDAAADTFEFKASIEPDRGTVEGILRYHPFLYDKETYPKEPSAKEASQSHLFNDDECDDESGARGNRPIFECFWNGRLIPYTRINELDWFARPRGGDLPPPECYSRFSGVLFTDDKLEVSTNKLTFTDLELKLKKKETIFTYTVNGQKSVRSDIQKEFTQWLKNCHARLDKQVKFLCYKETITRADVAVKKMKHPWATFSTIECGSKMYKAGQLVSICFYCPVYNGRVIRFLLYGDHKEDAFATGGEVEITLEPKGLYDKTKIIPIAKIDMSATDEAIKKNIESDSARIPHRLQLYWPENNCWSQNDVRPAGTQLGPLRIEILNKKGESMSRIPTVGKAEVIKLSVKLRVVHHGPKEEESVNLVAQYSSKWGFWFNKIENLTKLGNYTLFLNAMINERNEMVYGGNELPKCKLKFAIKAASAEHFAIDEMNSTLQVGVLFDIPLQIKDHYGHATAPPANAQPVLNCSGLGLSYETVESSDTTVTIRNVKASGKVQNFQQPKTYNLEVTLPGLKKAKQTIKISLLPGPPHSLHVKPDDSPVTVENGNPLKFNVEIHDEAGNITVGPKHVVRCQVQGLPPVTIDCSSTGAGQVVTKPINLKIFNGESQKLKVQLNIPNQRSIPMVAWELTVMPSTRVCLMELCSQDDKKLVLTNNERIDWLAGGVLENLFYKLYNESGKEVALTPEIASRIKVNWAGDLCIEDLVQGKLPDVQVPQRAQEAHFYQVSYQDQSVSVSFKITPHPDEPVRLKATLLQSVVKLGETLPGNIHLELVDQYDNVTKTLNSTCVNNITVDAEDLDKSAISLMWQESSHSVSVAGVCFQGGAPGSREISFIYGTFVGTVIVKLTAGDPAELKLISQPDQPLRVLNDHSIPTPFLIQLFDKWGNPSSDRRVVVELKPSHPSLKVTADVASRPVDVEGKASFTVNCVSGSKGHYQLMFRGSFNHKPIPGPSVSLTVLPDPNKPVSLSVEYDTNARFPAKGTFPVFSVTVVSDEGSPITTFNPAAISMFLWEGVPTRGTSPLTELKCSKPLENEKKDCFYFRDKEIPEQAGKYTIQFSLRIDEARVLDKQIPINVVANQPVKLGPDSPPPCPVVSNSKDIADRTLMENMTLRIMDAHGNPTGQDLNGMVVVSIKNSSGESDLLFEGGINRHRFNLVEGKIHIPRLAIMEDPLGTDGGAYTLLFEPEVSLVPTPLTSFELTFHFYSDAESQKKMCQLSKEKEELTSAVARFADFFSDSNSFLKMLTKRLLDLNRKVTDMRRVLVQMEILTVQNTSAADIDRFIKEKTAEAGEILKMSKRVCSIPHHFRGQQGVLGKVGHLAYVEDDAAAWVISWHISGDMDCVITRSTETAMRIYKDTQGIQQVMPLDTIFVFPGSRPLPHIRGGQALFDPPGNPVYARELLIFPNNKMECEIVFKNILGDTILIDNLESGNNYRKLVVQNKIPCPTILTRQGQRISAKGKFGGAQNKAPPMNTLRLFGSPPPHRYHALKEQIELVSQYQLALKKKEETEKEREDHLKMLKSPDTQKKKEQMDEQKKQLEMIERQLASTPVRPGKRGSQDAGEPSGINTKRARQRPT